MNALRHLAAVLLALGLCSLLLACSPLSDEATKALFETMKDKSGCGLIGGGAGSGTIIVPVPSVPMGAGYGYFWFAHADANHSAELTPDGGCKLTVVDQTPIVVVPMPSTPSTPEPSTSIRY